MRSWKFLLPLLASSLCFAAQPGRITGPIDSSQMVPLKGNVHRLAQPQYDQGLVEDSLQFGYVTLVMAPSRGQQVALNQLLAQQQDRSSPNYHKWLTPQQFADRFGLSQNDITKITTWLTSQGFQIASVGGGRNSVVFSGTAAQIQSAFKTQIHRYNINGKVHIANSMPPSMPAALSGVVSQVRGLTDFRPKPMYVRPVHGGKLGPHPSYTTTVQGNTTYFVAPGDIATLYDLNPLYSATPAIDGTNQKLAIIGQTDVYLADITNFRSGFGLNPITGCTANSSGILTACDSTNFKYVVVGTDLGAPSTCGDVVEADLDIEWSGATARNAQIIYVNAPATFNSDCTQLTNSGGVDAALQAAINPPVGPPLAPVISMSYGLCEADAESLETELTQANVEGVTILNSAGDSGSAACDGGPPGTNPQPPFAAAQFGLAVSYPASSPEVTGVGGTSIPAADFTAAFWSGTNGTAGGSALAALIGQEAAWNDDEALAQFCVENPSNTFCNPSPGVKVTSAQTFQQDYWISVGGGGASNCVNETGSICDSGFTRPVWQQAISIPSLGSTQSTYRLVPDVSLLASPNYPGYILCTPIENLSNTSPYDTETTSSCGTGNASGIEAAADGVLSGNNFVVDPSIIGGTSASTPVFAGIVTLLNQYLGSSGLGNINSTLYGLASAPSTAAFHSVKGGDNDVYCQPGQPSGNPADVICPSTGTSAGIIGFSAASADTTTGYNLVTGLGSVDANALALAWKASLDPDFQFAPPPVNPAPVPAGQSTSTTLTISPITGSSALTVNFAPSNCTGLPTGASCSFNPTSVYFDGTDPAPPVVLTITTLATTPLGTQKITIVPTNSPSTSTSVMLTVSATNQSFTIASNAKTYSVVPGGTAQVQITVAGTNGFVNTSNSTTALPVTYTCLQISLPTEVQCSFSPTGGAAVSSTSLSLNITTTGPTSRAQPPLGHGSRLYYALLLPGLFGILFASGSRGRGARLLGLIVVLGVSSLGVSSCGGSSGGVQENTGTPAGTYAIIVNSTTAGPNPLTAPPLTVNLTVQ
jgi:subtilase family serine protease